MLLKGLLSSLILSVTALIFSVVMYGIVILKIAVPSLSFKRRCTLWLEKTSDALTSVNLGLFSLLQNTQWEVSGVEGLSPQKWYFLICNHQSFVDIFVLEKVLMKRVAPFKYFIKQSLIWMPIVGVVWWGLDHIFMKRYPKAVLEKNPHLREVDKQRTRKKCLQFKHKPVTIVSFIEGTRFTLKKHQHQQSNHQKLLKPKAGGLAYMMAAMDGRIKEIINVTIVYSPNCCSFWDYLCGKIRKIQVHVEVLPIPLSLLKGDYVQDTHYRAQLQAWLTELWTEKDKLLVRMAQNNP